MKIKNTFIIFTVSGFWHGANWTFIIWGLLNAIYIMPSIVLSTNRVNLEIVAKGKNWPTLKELFSMLLTFTLTVFAWIFFRANDLSHALVYISGIFTKSLLSVPAYKPPYLFFLLLFFILIEWMGREQQYALQKIGLPWKKTIRWLFYYTIIIVTFYFSVSTSNQAFIYFQF